MGVLLGVRRAGQLAPVKPALFYFCDKNFSGTFGKLFGFAVYNRLMEFKGKKFFISDIVKFVPYYIPAGMQGATLQVQVPAHSCLAMVTAVYHKQIKVMLPNGSQKTYGKAGLEAIISTEQKID